MVKHFQIQKISVVTDENNIPKATLSRSRSREKKVGSVWDSNSRTAITLTIT